MSLRLRRKEDPFWKGEPLRVGGCGKERSEEVRKGCQWAVGSGQWTVDSRQ